MIPNEKTRREQVYIKTIKRFNKFCRVINHVESIHQISYGINETELPAGMYVLIVGNEKRRESFKLVLK